MDELAQAAGQDPLEFRRKLMAKHPKHLAVLNAVGREGRLGQAAPAGRLPRPRADDGLRQLRGGGAEVSVSRRQQDQDPPHRRRRPIRATPSIRRRSSGRSPARSSTACRRCSTASAPSRTAASSRRTSTPTTRCASREMPKVEAIVMPSGGRLGRRRRADDLRGGAGGAQRVSPRRPASASARSR